MVAARAGAMAVSMAAALADRTTLVVTCQALVLTVLSLRAKLLKRLLDKLRVSYFQIVDLLLQFTSKSQQAQKLRNILLMYLTEMGEQAIQRLETPPSERSHKAT